MILFSELSSKFQIIDFACTHCQLLLRSNKNRDRKYNIDILFKPINVMIIPSFIQGVEISIDGFPEEQALLIDKYGFEVDDSYKIFRIKDAAGKLFYINAMAFYVFHNNQVTPIESGLKDGRGGIPGAFGEDVMSYPSEC